MKINIFFSEDFRYDRLPPNDCFTESQSKKSYFFSVPRGLPGDPPTTELENSGLQIATRVRNLLIFLANIRHVRFNMVNSKHQYCTCLLIKICRPYRIVFTFHENLSNEKLPEMKRTFLFF